MQLLAAQRAVRNETGKFFSRSKKNSQFRSDRSSMRRMRLAAFALFLCIGCYSCGHGRGTMLLTTATSAGSVTRTTLRTFGKVDFTKDVQPIFERKCQPCHFNGGKVYQKLPFDRPETIKTLGEKLFTRIKSEDERRLIREFLSQP
jgi:hypothetical protein